MKRIIFGMFFIGVGLSFSAEGIIQNVEVHTENETTANACHENKIFIKMNDQWYITDGTTAGGKNILALAMTLMTTETEASIKTIGTLCSSSYKQIRYIAKKD